MKLLSLLLCFIVTVQIFTFCADAVIGERGASYVSYEQQDVSKDAPDQHAHKDLCSPFCQCACCATPTVAAVSSFFIHLSLTGNNLFINPNTPGFIDISFSVWQPPQSA